MCAIRGPYRPDFVAPRVLHPAPLCLQPLDSPHKLEMTIFTKGKDDVWPYGIEWLNDAYPIPYWARKQIEARQAAEKAAAQAAAPGAAEEEALTGMGSSKGSQP